MWWASRRTVARLGATTRQGHAQRVAHVHSTQLLLHLVSRQVEQPLATPTAQFLDKELFQVLLANPVALRIEHSLHHTRPYRLLNPVTKHLLALRFG